jgi:hypothetical protein
MVSGTQVMHVRKRHSYLKDIHSVFDAEVPGDDVINAAVTPKVIGVQDTIPQLFFGLSVMQSIMFNVFSVAGK